MELVFALMLTVAGETEVMDYNLSLEDCVTEMVTGMESGIGGEWTCAPEYYIGLNVPK